MIPGPDGILPTSPIASAPWLIASSASAMDEMQQTFILVLFMNSFATNDRVSVKKIELGNHLVINSQ